MSLSTRQRSSIYQKLIPVLGEEDADALMAEFPATEHDQLVTREHLRAELVLLRGDLRSEMQGLATDLRSEMQGLATELRSEMQGLATELRSEVQGLAADLRSEMQGLATRAELRSEIQGVREELREFRVEVHAHINRAMAATTGVALAAMGVLATVA